MAWETLLEIAFGLVALGIVLHFCYRVSADLRISFWAALALCVLCSPLIGYFLVCLFPARRQESCRYCGNPHLEAPRPQGTFRCGLCGEITDPHMIIDPVRTGLRDDDSSKG